MMHVKIKCSEINNFAHNEKIPDVFSPFRSQIFERKIFRFKVQNVLNTYKTKLSTMSSMQSSRWYLWGEGGGHIYFEFRYGKNKILKRNRGFGAVKKIKLNILQSIVVL